MQNEPAQKQLTLTSNQEISDIENQYFELVKTHGLVFEYTSNDNGKSTNKAKDQYGEVYELESNQYIEDGEIFQESDTEDSDENDSQGLLFEYFYNDYLTDTNQAKDQYGRIYELESNQYIEDGEIMQYDTEDSNSEEYLESISEHISEIDNSESISEYISEIDNSENSVEYDSDSDSSSESGSISEQESENEYELVQTKGLVLKYTRDQHNIVEDQDGNKYQLESKQYLNMKGKIYQETDQQQVMAQENCQKYELVNTYGLQFEYVVDENRNTKNLIKDQFGSEYVLESNMYIEKDGQLYFEQVEESGN